MIVDSCDLDVQNPSFQFTGNRRARNAELEKKSARLWEARTGIIAEEGQTKRFRARDELQ